MTDNETLDTYNNSAEKFADYFKGIGTRVLDIERALELAGKTDGSAVVLELGCGDGRDATSIVERVHSYTGMDYSGELIRLAKDKLPEADFRVADIQDFEFPEDFYDVVFAFASLLHVDRAGNERIFQRVARSLKPGGIFYVSLKKADEYEERVQVDEFGTRTFYYYNPTLVDEMSSDYFDVANVTEQTIGHTMWFETALRKK